MNRRFVLLSRCVLGLLVLGLCTSLTTPGVELKLPDCLPLPSQLVELEGRITIRVFVRRDLKEVRLHNVLQQTVEREGRALAAPEQHLLHQWLSHYAHAIRATYADSCGLNADVLCTVPIVFRPERCCEVR